MGDAVAVTDEDVLTIEMVGRTMASGLEIRLVAFEEELAATVAHVPAIRVEIRTVDAFAAPNSHPVITL